MSCQRCGSRCQGALCEQCAILDEYEHLADELASDDTEDETDD